MKELFDGPARSAGLIVDRPVIGGSLLKVLNEAIEGLSGEQREPFERDTENPSIRLLTRRKSRYFLGNYDVWSSVVGAVLLEAIPSLRESYPRPLCVAGPADVITTGGMRYLNAALEVDPEDLAATLPYRDKACIYEALGRISDINRTPNNVPDITLAVLPNGPTPTEETWGQLHDYVAARLPLEAACGPARIQPKPAVLPPPTAAPNTI